MTHQQSNNNQTSVRATGEHDSRTRSHRMWAIAFAALWGAGCLASGDATTKPSVPDSSLAMAGSENTRIRDSLGTELAPVSAAIVRANAQADVDLNLLARIEVQPDEMLEIYEPTPGSILVTGAGAPAGKAILSADAVAGMAIEDVWRLATGSAEMPGELRAAFERANQRQQNSGSMIPQGDDTKAGGSSSSSLDMAASGATTSPVALASGWCDSGYYSSGYGDCPSGYDVSVCLNDWLNGAYAFDYNGAFYAYTNVCPATGAVTLSVQSDHGGGGIWSVAQNTVRWWSQSDFGCIFDCLDVRADVGQASGDRFQFRFLSLD